MEGIEYLEKFGGWVRPGTLDEYVFKEIRPSYNMLDIQEGDTVLDIGANIGAFSLYATQEGADKVYSYEPDEDNFQLLNVNSPNSVNTRCAVVGDDSDYVYLYVNSKKNKGLHMTREVRGRDAVKVLALKFDDIINDRKPNKIKIDVEGAEYGFMPYVFPDYVEKLVMEIHFQYDSTWRAKGKELNQSMLDQGFKPMREYRDTGNNWHTIGAYTR
jgi:FkbM family methyltransferase